MVDLVAVSPQPIWDLLFQERIFPASNVETAYLLRYAYDVDATVFNLTDEQRERLDDSFDEVGTRDPRQSRRSIER